MGECILLLFMLMRYMLSRGFELGCGGYLEIAAKQFIGQTYGVAAEPQYSRLS